MDVGMKPSTRTERASSADYLLLMQLPRTAVVSPHILVCKLVDSHAVDDGSTRVHLVLPIPSLWQDRTMRLHNLPRLGMDQEAIHELRDSHSKQLDITVNLPCHN